MQSLSEQFAECSSIVCSPARYLCETYDTKARLIPRDLPEKVKVKEWIGASEGTFLLHALTVSIDT